MTNSDILCLPAPGPVVALLPKPKKPVTIPLCNLDLKEVPKHRVRLQQLPPLKLDLPRPYTGGSIRKRIINMLKGQGDAKGFTLYVNRARGTSRTLVYFNPTSIHIYYQLYKRNSRHGGIYVSKESFSKRIYFKGHITILKIRGGKHKVMISEEFTNTSPLPKIVLKYVGLYLKHFGYNTTKLHRAIVPLFDIRVNKVFYPCRLKGAWRESTPEAVLAKAGLPTNKSMVRTLASIVSRLPEHRDLSKLSAYERVLEFNSRQSQTPPVPKVPYLSLIHLIWVISENVDITKQALISGISLDFNHPELKHTTRALRWALKEWSKGERVQLAKDMLRDSMGARLSGTAIDTILMVKTIYKSRFKVNGGLKKHQPVIVSRGFHRLHDELSVKVALIEDSNIKKAIRYEEKYKNIDGIELADGTKLILPKSGVDVQLAGNKLHNCLASYARRIVDRQTTIILMYKCSKVVGAIEVNTKGQLVQAFLFANKTMEIKRFDDLYKTLVEHKIVDENAPIPFQYRRGR